MTKVDKGWEIGIAVDISNNGKSPAIDVQSTPSHVIYGPTSDSAHQVLDWDPNFEHLAQGYMLSVNDSKTVITETPLPILTQEQYEAFQAGTWQIFVVGSVRYKDFTNPAAVPFETPYCYRLTPIGLPFMSQNLPRHKPT